MVACYFAYVHAFGQMTAEEIESRLWQRLAYATRYGRGITLTEALQIGTYELLRYNEALNQIVEQENTSTKK